MDTSVYPPLICQRIGCVGKQLVFYLILILCREQGTVHGHENETIECAEEITLSGVEANCQSECSTSCMCTLTEVDIVNNCTDGVVLEIPVLYPLENVIELSWRNSTLHCIQPGAFTRFGGTLEQLDLSYNALQRVEVGVFERLTSLHALDLSNNALKKIEAGVFEGLANLTVLLLNDNALENIEAGVFDGLGNLERLYLYNIMLETIDTGVFVGLGMLQILDMSNSGLQKIETGAFDGLVRLSWLVLSNNKLETIETGVFDGLRNLEELELSNNGLQKIDARVFGGLASLYWLGLSNNALETIEAGAFDGLGMLSWLVLSNNTLEAIEAGVFDGLENLEELELSNNALDKIEAGAFDELGMLVSLFLSNNAMETIDGGVFVGLRNLHSLHFSNNALKKVEAGVFGGLELLNWLDLSNNALENIEVGMFDGLEWLTMIDLRNNALEKIETGVFDGLEILYWLDMSNNRLQRIDAGVFNGLEMLEELGLSYNALTRIEVGVFDVLERLEVLGLSYNSLCEIAPNGFEQLGNLTVLYLQNNALTILHPQTFQNQTKLKILVLNHNKLHNLPETNFGSLTNLEYLDLSVNELNSLPMLSRCSSIQMINLKENPLLWMESKVFSGLPENVTIFVTSHTTCCYAFSVDCKSEQPRSPFLTCARMLNSSFLRIIMWFMSAFGIIGNAFALYTQFAHREESDKVQFLLITNLSISDFAMCIYLVILLSVDAYYTDYFPSSSEHWRKSVFCRLSGSVSVLSSEASTFLITLISIDRCLGIKYPFGGCRLGKKVARFLVIIIWLVAFSLTVSTFVLSGEDSLVYSISEVCVGLPISKFKFRNESSISYTTYTAELGWREESTISQAKYTNSKASMYLSIAMFTGLNLVCFSIVGFCYTHIFITARKTTRASGRSRTSNEEMRLALRTSLLVLTDFLCWVPVGILSILVQAGAVEVHPVAYAWIATFILPINSVINPFIYTLGGFLFGTKKWPCCKRRRQEGNIQMKQTAK